MRDCRLLAGAMVKLSIALVLNIVRVFVTYKLKNSMEHEL
jgi:hypothetical protein